MGGRWRGAAGGEGETAVKLVSFRVKPKKQTRGKTATVRKTEIVKTMERPKRIPGRPPARRRKKKNIRPLIVLGGLFLLVFAVAGLLFVTRMALSNGLEESVTYVDGIPVHHDYLEEGAAGRQGKNGKSNMLSSMRPTMTRWVQTPKVIINLFTPMAGRRSELALHRG